MRLRDRRADVAKHVVDCRGDTAYAGNQRQTNQAQHQRIFGQVLTLLVSLQVMESYIQRCK